MDGHTIVVCLGSNMDSYSVAVARSSKWLAARDGALIALVNPKTIVFFSALFSQFVDASSQLWEKPLMAVIAGWCRYALVHGCGCSYLPVCLTDCHPQAQWLDKQGCLQLYFC